jgi:hypothetical protein
MRIDGRIVVLPTARLAADLGYDGLSNPASWCSRAALNTEDRPMKDFTVNLSEDRR